MAKNLVIVESPAKAKTIEKYLGKDFTVLSSVGHIRAIPRKTKDGKPPIDIDNNFATTYEIDPEKRKIITGLKKAVKSADSIWLATDEDREGEAIAWHLCEVLGLDPRQTKRIVFHEITKTAIETAVQNARTIDMHLVEAQQARQILDRIVGFELSPVVWQKVPGGKSAGRVQSPAVRLLVEREREITEFEGSSEFKLNAEFQKGTEYFISEMPIRFKNEQDAHDMLKRLIGSTFTVTNVIKSPGKRNPSAPFTTSTLQQEANAKLGFGSRTTMSAAQKLYQSGRITYMRTDSMSLSKQAIGAAASYIEQTYGKEYVQVRTYATKSKGAQEAHEAIRPTDMSLEKASTDSYEQKLYTLIRNRTIASQMASAQLEKTTGTITAKTQDDLSPAPVFEAKGEVIVFDGFLKVYGVQNKDDAMLPALDTGDLLTCNSIRAKEIFARPPARYTEGSLVKKLEELGIGRPSTYATIINTVLVRGYAEKGDSEGTARQAVLLTGSPGSNTISRELITENTGSNKGKLVPTPSGFLIADFLSNHFNPIVDYGFTAKVEEHFDEIAANKLPRNQMLHSFYKPFHSLIESSGEIDRSTVAQAREIGTDPKTGKQIFARYGRFGPLLQLGITESKDEKPIFAPMPKGQTVETVTLDAALKAFELPRLVGQTEDGQDIRANIGRFGPYIQVGKLFVSIKPYDPHEITLAESRQLYSAKLLSEAEKNIADLGDNIKVLKGRWGPYVTDGKKNAKIDKNTDPATLTLHAAKKLLKDAPARPKRSSTRKRQLKK